MLFLFKFLIVTGILVFGVNYLIQMQKFEKINKYKSEEERKGAELEEVITKLAEGKPGVKVLNNIIIPNLTGKTTEIDVILFSKKGFFVIEAKNYFGHIQGNKAWKKWTVIYDKKKGIKRTLRNPIYQNLNHIKCLRVMFPRFRFDNIVVFGEKASLSQELFKTPNIKTLKGFEYFMNNTFENKEDVLTEEEVESVYNFLKRYKDGDREAHIEFVNSIKAKMEGAIA